MAGRGGFVFFSRRDGAVFFFSEAGRGGFFFFLRRDGAVFFFSETGRGGFFFFSTGRDGAVFFFFFRGPGRDGCFWRWQFFWRDGAKSLHRPAKGGLNRPASRPCKALENSLYRGMLRRSRCVLFFSLKHPCMTINDIIQYTSVHFTIYPRPYFCMMMSRWYNYRQ